MKRTLCFLNDVAEVSDHLLPFSILADVEPLLENKDTHMRYNCTRMSKIRNQVLFISVYAWLALK